MTVARQIHADARRIQKFNFHYIRPISAAIADTGWKSQPRIEIRPHSAARLTRGKRLPPPLLMGRFAAASGRLFVRPRRCRA
jgi:hypothetical protein